MWCYQPPICKSLALLPVYRTKISLTMACDISSSFYFDCHCSNLECTLFSCINRVPCSRKYPLSQNIHSTSILCSRFRHVWPKRHIHSALNLWEVKEAMLIKIQFPRTFEIPRWMSHFLHKLVKLSNNQFFLHCIFGRIRTREQKILMLIVPILHC